MTSTTTNKSSILEHRAAARTPAVLGYFSQRTAIFSPG
jgi:hypothetical protein